MQQLCDELLTCPGCTPIIQCQLDSFTIHLTPNVRTCGFTYCSVVTVTHPIFSQAKLWCNFVQALSPNGLNLILYTNAIYLFIFYHSTAYTKFPSCTSIKGLILDFSVAHSIACHLIVHARSLQQRQLHRF